MKNLRNIFSLLLLLSPLGAGASGWTDLVDKLQKNIKPETVSSVQTVLSEKTVADALKQALDQGIKKSVSRLGAANGFLHDDTVKIMMPQTLQKLERGLRRIGQNKTADEFIATMNHAAEQAAAKTADILLAALKTMSLQEAINILKGPEDAATQYFRRNSEASLRDMIRPVVQDATSAVGLTENYKKLISKAGVLARYIDKDSLDIDLYVTNQTLNGLFIKMADEEKQIRTTPLARSTELLKTVFGSLDK